MESNQPSPESSNPRINSPGKGKNQSIASRFTLILVGLTCLVLLLLGISTFNHNDQGWLPVALHSVLSADYSSDPAGSRVAPMRLALIQESILDTLQKTPFPSLAPTSWLATLAGSLLTPVPSVTPNPGAFPTVIPTLFNQIPTPTAPHHTATSAVRATGTPLPAVTQTPLTGSSTAPPTPTSISAKTSTATTRPTYTKVPENTPRPTTGATSTRLAPTQPPPTQPGPTHPPPTQPPPTNPPPTQPPPPPTNPPPPTDPPPPPTEPPPPPTQPPPDPTDPPYPPPPYP